MDLKNLVLNLCEKIGVSGIETGAVSYAKSVLDEIGETRISPLGSVICTLHAPKEGGKHIMLDAHIDEIGMIVTYIDDKGFLKVAPCGGIDRRLLLASPLTIHGKKDIKGVVCSMPPHLQEGEAKNLKVDEIAVDIGFTKEEAEEIVSVGDRVTIDSKSQMLLNDLVSSKSLDDRAGCAAVIYAGYLIKQQNPNVGVTLCLSTMEEVGGQGAKTAAYDINPTHAIAVDVSFAHTPDAKPEKCGVLDKGPMVGVSPILNKEMSEKLMSLAKENNIPYQIEAMGGKTSTNADEIAITRGGVVTGLLSIPQRYMHTPIETVSLKDIENTAKLMAEYVKTLGD